ncbi:hypothetical protein JB92DRAFT_2904495 [Gautieria morchelliformis]|nr:hypothetical protein JB92DRAFT_2904495 [Gautieria morchelliformis]
MEATQSIHDQELALVRNELHRRDNLINSLQDAKIMLENSLAKHLQVEAKKRATPVKSGPAVMDFVNWPSSQSDVFVLDSVPPAQDKDEPSTAPDDPPAEEEKTTWRPSNDRPLDSPEQPFGSIASGTAGNHRNFVTPSGGSKKAYFSTLAELSEIGDFDDEGEAGVKWQTDLAAQAAAKAESSRPTKRSVRGG